MGLAVVFPDTSPRGVNIPGEDDSWDFGSAAGFYVDATAEPWSKHYKMYSYITKELPELINVSNCKFYRLEQFVSNACPHFDNVFCL